MNTVLPGDDDDKKAETPEETILPKIEVEDDVIVTDDEDPGRDVTSVPDPKRKK